MRDCLPFLRRGRPYITLLRLPFQLKLGPIFGWGFLMGGGSLVNSIKVPEMIAIFAAFHIGAFGGLTALNSYYDRDDGPIGGLWTPPAPPKYLGAFAWSVQLTGLATVALIDLRLATIYALIVTLAFGYSHPALRWKNHPWKSVAVVAMGQGILDFAAGAITATRTSHSFPLPLSLWCAGAGATLVVCAFYPLTQLFQTQDDEARGDRTLAIELQKCGGASGPFRWAQALLTLAAILNLSALVAAKEAGWPLGLLFFAGLSGGVWKLELWRRDYLRRQADPTDLSALEARIVDFKIVHRLFGWSSLLFAFVILVYLLHDSAR
ncbi:MAG: hypothetical protein JWN98_689 [Abditibacteriota bacterium]|nr:hypothetical protein [Abditibacteriota bacterium]